MGPTTTPFWKRHLLYWGIYAAYFYLLNILVNKDFSFLTLVLMLPYFAFVFYLVLYLLKRFFRPGNYLKGALFLALFYVVSGLLVYHVLYGSLGINLLHGRYILRHYQFDWRQFLQSLLVMHGHFSILAFLYFHYQGKLKAIQDKLNEAQRRLEAEEEKQQYEYIARAAQVNPHMMANIFQSWEGQVRAAHPQIAEQFGLMYQLMAFYMKAHDDEGAKVILLYDEIEAVKTYIQLQQYSLGRTCFVDFKVVGNLSRFAIPPTTILTLVKNAFKHGDITDQESPLEIRIACEQQRYTVAVRNKKRRGRSGLESHGHGIPNLSRRLELALGSRCRYAIADTTDYYQSSITVDYTF